MNQADTDKASPKPAEANDGSGSRPSNACSNTPIMALNTVVEPRLCHKLEPTILPITIEDHRHCVPVQPVLSASHQGPTVIERCPHRSPTPRDNFQSQFLESIIACHLGNSRVWATLAPSPTENPRTLPTEHLQYSLQPPSPPQNNTYHESVISGGPPMSQLASPPSPQNNTYHGWCQSATTTVVMAAFVTGRRFVGLFLVIFHVVAGQPTVSRSSGKFLLFPFR